MAGRSRSTPRCAVPCDARCPTCGLHNKHAGRQDGPCLQCGRTLNFACRASANHCRWHRAEAAAAAAVPVVDRLAAMLSPERVGDGPSPREVYRALLEASPKDAHRMAVALTTAQAVEAQTDASLTPIQRGWFTRSAAQAAKAAHALEIAAADRGFTINGNAGPVRIVYEVTNEPLPARPADVGDEDLAMVDVTPGEA